MLPHHTRLRAAEVVGVLARGHSVWAGHFSAKFFRGKEHSRVAVVVPKAVARRAVERNRLRRMLYRTLKPLLPARDLQMVLLLRGPLHTSDVAALPHDLKALLRRL